MGGALGDRHGNTHRVTQVKAIERRGGGDWTPAAVVCDCEYKRCVGGRGEEEEEEAEEERRTQNPSIEARAHNTNTHTHTLDLLVQRPQFNSSKFDLMLLS